MEPRVELKEVALQVFPVLLPRHAVDSRRGPLREVRVPKPIDGEVVEKRREPCVIEPSWLFHNRPQKRPDRGAGITGFSIPRVDLDRRGGNHGL